MSQTAGARWQTTRREGETHREAGRQGGRGHSYRGGGPGLGHAAQTKAEAAMRWWMGEATQAELAMEYSVSRSTIRRWCSSLQVDAPEGP